MSRRSAVFALLILGGLILWCATAPWVTSSTDSVLGERLELVATGREAAPGVAAAALALLATGIAAGLVGRIGRWVIVCGTALAAAVTILSTTSVIFDARAVALRSAAASTGVAHLTGDVQTRLWPWIALVLGGTGLVLAASIARGSGGWRFGPGRHDLGQAQPYGGSGADAPDGAPAARIGDPDQGTAGTQQDQDFDPAALWDEQTQDNSGRFGD